MDDQAYQDLFYKKPPQFTFSQPATEREAQRQDANFLRNYIDLDQSYTRTSKLEAEGRLDGLLAKAGSLSSAKRWPLR